MALSAISNAASRAVEGAQTALGIPPYHTKSIHKQIRIQKLFVHPIKSCRGSSVSEAHFDEGGLRYDRSWLIIDAQSKKFQTARDLPKLVTIDPRIDLANNTLSIHIPLHERGKASVTVTTPLDPSAEELKQMELIEGVKIWVHTANGYAVSKEADEALSQFFGRDVRLVRKGPTVRPSGPDDPRGEESAVHFQDFYPLLIASSASLQHVRDTLTASVYSHSTSSTNDEQKTDASTDTSPSATPPGGWESETGETDVRAYKVPDSLRREYWTPEQLETLDIQRFRPNVLVESCSSGGDDDGGKLLPWEEDGWTHLEVFDGKQEASGDLKAGWGSEAVGKGTGIDCVVRCGRCMVPSIDPDSGYRDPHLPYLVLQRFRIVQPELKRLGKPCFGMLSSPSQTSGTLRVGDIVRVTATTDPAKRTMRT